MRWRQRRQRKSTVSRVRSPLPSRIIGLPLLPTAPRYNVPSHNLRRCAIIGRARLGGGYRRISIWKGVGGMDEQVPLDHLVLNLLALAEVAPDLPPEVLARV